MGIARGRSGQHLLPEWEPSPGSAPKPTRPASYAWAGRLAVIALIFGIVCGASVWVDTVAWNNVKRDSVLTAATVRAIHAHDDFIVPSAVQVELESSPPRMLTVRTIQEELYSVGQQVQVYYDARHPGRAGFLHDSTGPTWTLGGMLIGAIAGCLALIAAGIVAITTACRRRQQRRREAMRGAPKNRTVIASTVRDLLRQAPDSLPFDPVRARAALRTDTRRLVGELVTTVCVFGVAAVVGIGLRIVVFGVRVRLGDTLPLILVSAGSIIAIGVYRMYLRGGERDRWVSVAATRIGGEYVLLVEDEEHAELFSGFGGKDGDASSFELAIPTTPQRVWLSTGRGLLLYNPHQLGSFCLLSPVDGWQYKDIVRGTTTVTSP